MKSKTNWKLPLIILSIIDRIYFNQPEDNNESE